jgi:glycerol kinase
VVRPAEVEATARGIAWLAAGCPAAWTHASRSERFAPRSNPDLQVRYRQFIDVLTQALAA